MSNDKVIEGESLLSLEEKRVARAKADAAARLIDVGGMSIDPETGCWLWNGAVNGRGYPTTGDGLVYRKVFKMISGMDIPPRVEIDHVCRRPLCVRPAHLDPVTREENQRRKHVLRRVPARCPIGHMLTAPESRGQTPEGGVYCRNCLELKSQEQDVLDWLDKM